MSFSFCDTYSKNTLHLPLLFVFNRNNHTILGQSPRHNMWLLQYILYRILLFNTDCYNTYYVE